MNSETEAWFVPVSVLLQPLAVRPIVKASDALIYKNATFSPIQFIAAQINTKSRDGYIRILDLNTTWEAIEYSIEPVIQSIRAQVQNNIYREEVLASWAQSDLIKTTLIFKPNWGPEFGASLTQNFSLDARAASAIDSLLSEIFNGALAQDSRLNVYYMSSAYLYAGVDVIEALSTGNISGCSLEAVEKFPCSMHNVAAAISKSFRDSAYISADSDPIRAQIAIGDVKRTMTYISVQWKWIALPVLVWLLGVVTLIGTVWKTARAKASQVAE